MKYLKPLGALLALISLVACQSDSPLPFNYVRFELDGEIWETTQTTTSYADFGSNIILNIQATRNNSQTIEIRISDFNTNDLFIFVANASGNNQIRLSDTTFFDNSSLSTLNCSPISGQVSITAVDELQISGTFDAVVCEGNQEKVITRGIFERLLY